MGRVTISQRTMGVKRVPALPNRIGGRNMGAVGHRRHRYRLVGSYASVLRWTVGSTCNHTSGR